MDHHPAMGQLFGVITLGPDAGEQAEIGFAQFFAIRIVPQANGHRREMPGADQFAFFTDHRVAFVVPHFNGHAQALAHDFAAPHGRHRVAVDEARDDVGAAGHRSQAHVSLEVAIDEVVTVRRQRRAGAKQRLEAAQVMTFTGLDTAAFQGCEVFGTGAEDADAFVVDQVDQALWIGLER
ncbi:hypothetical protein D9M71_177510 [compost metagenome]